MTTLELDSLLAPIEGEAPCGPDLRSDFDSRYHEALTARDVARRTERELDTATAPDGSPRYSAADVRQRWAALRDVATTFLANDSKDLHVAAWLIEAELRLEGFDGLRSGFDLARGLVETFWDGLNPGPDGDPDPDETPLTERFRHLSALNGDGVGGTLIVPLSLVPLATDADGADITPYTLEQAIASERSGSTDPLAHARRGLGELSVERLTQLAAGPGAARESLIAMEAAIRERSEADSPPIGAVRDVLEQIERNLRYALEGVPNGGAALAALSEAQEGDGPEEGTDESAEGVAEDAGGPDAVIVPVARRANAPAEPPTTREEAVRQLRNAANWFRENERHSPIAYVCDRTVRWTSMTLPELMDELIDDESARGSFFRLTGIANHDDGA